METINYPYVPNRPSESSVLRRLGYNKNTIIDVSDMMRMDNMILRAADFCRPKAKSCVISIKKKKEKSVILDNGLIIESLKLAKLLMNSKKILIMGATLGEDIVQKINHEIGFGDAEFGVVLDAYASECVDDTLSYIMKSESLKDFRLGGKVTKHRFSAGYGDLDISYQKNFYDILKMDEIGVEINDSFMLIPEKSVIALAGLERR